MKLLKSPYQNPFTGHWEFQYEDCDGVTRCPAFYTWAECYQHALNLFGYCVTMDKQREEATPTRTAQSAVERSRESEQ